jgi:hypothetical protein
MQGKFEKNYFTRYAFACDALFLWLFRLHLPVCKMTYTPFFELTKYFCWKMQFLGDFGAFRGGK